MKRILLFFTIIFVELLFCACENKDALRTPSTKSKTKVRVEVAHQAAISADKVYSGTLEEGSATPVSFASIGTIQTLNVREGQKITKGSLIGTLNETSAASALEIAQALKLQAEDAHARMKTLHENKSISEIQWMEAESKYKQAVGSEKIARKALADCKLYAPATGIIANKKAEPGQNVLPGVPILDIVDIKKVKAKVFVPESEISSVRVGNQVEVSVGALGGKTFNGKIGEKNVSAQLLSRSYAVSATLDNKNGELLPGMILEMRIFSKDSLYGISMPTSAILLDEKNETFVWIVKNGKAMRKNIIVKNDEAGEILIEGDISVGDSVIINGAQKVGSGTSVEIVP